MFASPYKNIIGLAQSRGSTATTHAGAARFLDQNLAKNCDAKPLHARGLGGGWRSLKNYNDEKLIRRGLAICAGLGLWPYDEAAALAAETDAAILVPYKSAIEGGQSYRVAQSRWAGGDHTISVGFAETPESVGASGESRQAWSSNGKWSGKNSHHRYTISRRLPLSLAIVGGLVTLDAEPVGRHEYRAVWAEQARGFDLRTVRGYIIRGHHVPTDNLSRARKIVAAARAKTMTVRLAERTQHHADRALNTVWVAVEDSLRAGNCVPATESVAAQIRRDLGGEVYAVRADYLLKIRNDQYARRAIAAAQQR